MSIILEDVSYAYDGGSPFAVQALDRVSLTVDDGSFLGLMGATGCGKTTLLRLAAGLLVPDSGRVLLDGEDINAAGYNRAQLRRALGMVFQFPEYQLFETTVERDVAFGLKHSGLDSGAVQERVRRALETVGFDFSAIRAQSPLSLSGGEKRRVAIAGVLAAGPKILLFDESIAGLDPMGRQDFLALTARLNREGVTILMVSHNADSLCACAERIVVLHQGRVALDGPPEAVFADLPRAKALSIGASQPRLIADLLRQRGFPLPQTITRYDALLAALQKGGERI